MAGSAALTVSAAGSSFDVVFVDEAGCRRREPLSACWERAFEKVLPVRAFPSAKDRVNWPGKPPQYAESPGRARANPQHPGVLRSSGTTAVLAQSIWPMSDPSTCELARLTEPPSSWLAHDIWPMWKSVDGSNRWTAG